MFPGCYGSLVCHDANNAACARCPVLEACSDKVVSTVEALREELNIGAYVKRFNLQRVKQGKAPVNIEELAQEIESKTAPASIKSEAPRLRCALTPDQEELIADSRYPVKARQEVEKFFRRGIDGAVIRRGLQSGENVLKEHGSRVFATGAQMLLAGGFTRSELFRSFMALDGAAMREATARSQAAIVFAAFELMGVGRVDPDGRLTLAA